MAATDPAYICRCGSFEQALYMVVTYICHEGYGSSMETPNTLNYITVVSQTGEGGR